MDKCARNNKILLVQLFSNGDCLYATTVAKQIKQDYPDCHLTWAVAGFCRSILEGNPYIDAILEINDVPKNDVVAFRRLKRRLYAEKGKGLWKELFITQNMDDNQAYYDGCIRTGILRAYPHPVTVDITPVIRLTEEEKEKAHAFAIAHELKSYQHRILFEFAPQSGQLPITKEFAVKLAEKIVENTENSVILSSALKINHPNKRIIDGSTLTLRETAALTFYCTHLIGCSSGITWITTSDSAKLLPMIQLINPNTDWVNPVSRDFQRHGKSTDSIIDLLNLNQQNIIRCLQLCLTDFPVAKQKYNEIIPVQFKTSRKIVYNLICYFQFEAIIKHIKVNTEEYGNNWSFYTQVALAFLFFPFTLLRNFLIKRILIPFKYRN
ncbi:MAG TPA: hypothetical protein PLS00_02480 [Niabella sp.]|nr:hypothetical protein [Agriterribacter sp.]HUN01697.1 hypothetical protein [Niabella sp.]